MYIRGELFLRSMFRLLLCTAIASLTERAGAQALSPQEAIERMKLAEGFEVRLFASEPEIRQPVSMTFDERGRIWVIQYLQYPTPAGLKPVEVDRYLRTKYDKVPEPPPKGVRGADRITIAEDSDGDGRADKFKDFTGGLNLATGLELGYGGVFVLQSPYLLFYPDRDRDDVPDGDPEVLLSGFGLEDAHALANSLTWGPDGWLYGAQGSTVTANIRGIEFQQGIWRYHPVTKEFELFSEGGGNTWGLDFDGHGNAIAGTNFGGVAMLHQMQGAYYLKNFGKHGELHNPYAFGYFDHVPYDKFIGGHVTCGGIVYQEDAFPSEFRGHYIAANLLSNVIHWHTLTPKGSSFTSKLGGVLLAANDPWFRPIDCAVGPDGAVFVADWYDKRANHVDPKDDWDRSNGRIYKIQRKGAKSAGPRDLSKLETEELVRLSVGTSQWHARMARRLLAERHDPGSITSLKKLALEEKDERRALAALWALDELNGIDNELAGQLLKHPAADVRTWVVRSVGDSKHLPSDLREDFVRLAREDSSPILRSQLACSARRFDGPDCLAILKPLLLRADDNDDAQIPLLLWWALESKAASDTNAILTMFESREIWGAPVVRSTITSRLARRYAAEGSDASYSALARLLALAPSPQDTDLLITGIEKGFEGRRFDKVPPTLASPLEKLRGAPEPSLALLRLGVRLSAAEAIQQTLQTIGNPKIEEKDRLALIQILGQAGPLESVPVLLALVGSAHQSDAVQNAALAALENFDLPEVPRLVLARYPKLEPAVRPRAVALLAGRQEPARSLLYAVDRGEIKPEAVSIDSLRRIMLRADPEMKGLVERHWGKIGRETEGEKRARINGINATLGLRKGDARQGREVFARTCGVCHTLFGEGKQIGPDLTTADRKNREFLITQIVDPSSVIRPEFVNHILEANDGRLLTGLLAESTPQQVTILDAKGERTSVPKSEIKDLRPSDVSLMPEELLDPLSFEEIQDLFRYLESDAPPPS